MADSGSLFSPLGEKSLYHRVVDRIRIAIFRGDIKPGDQLPSEPELARQLEVGRSAVREAIRILESAGLLTVRRGHGGGTFVQERDVATLVPVFADILRLALVEVSELTRTRILLESVVMQEAGVRIKPQHIAALHQNVDQATEYYRQGEVALRLAANLEFHMMLARIAASPVLELNVGAVLKLLSYYLETIQATSEMVDGTLAGHRQLVEHLAFGQVREAVELNREHIQTVSRKMIRRAEEDADKGLPARHLFDDGGIDERAV